MNDLATLDAATRSFDRRLRTVGEADWHRETPCEGWQVHDLVQHVIAGANAFLRSLHGAALDIVTATLATPSAGARTLPAAWQSSSAALAEAFQAPGAMDRRCVHPSGEMSGRGLLGVRVFDLTLHSWDLARALGGDARLDPQLVQASWDVLSDFLALKGLTGIGDGPSGRVAADAPLADRLLDVTGRRP